MQKGREHSIQGSKSLYSYTNPDSLRNINRESGIMEMKYSCYEIQVFGFETLIVNVM